MNTRKVVYLCCAVAVATFVATASFTYFYVTNQQSSEMRLSDQDYSTIKQFLDVGDLQKLVNQYYYKDVNTQTLVDGALKGMVAALNDPYSTYYTQDEYQAYNQKNDGTFVGIGATVSKDAATGYLRVVNVYKGAPAETAGLKDLDLITKVDNMDVKNISADELDDLLKGPVGSTVALSVLHSGSATPVDISVVRAQVQTQYVAYNMLNKDIMDVSINGFNQGAAQQFQDALKFAKDQGAKGVVLDLRNNLGGSVKECISIADLILPKGLICYTLDKEGKRDEFNADDQYNNIPIIVLVNGDTASASEILAGAIQDEGRGKLVGTQTYGKGVVQSVLDMPFSGGGVKLTSALYYTPKGRNINGIGLTPDVAVDLPDAVKAGTADLTAETDTQLKMAIDMMTQQLNPTSTPSALASASASPKESASAQ